VIRPLFLLSLLNKPIQASFTAEETSQDRIDSDTTPLLNSIEARRVQQLETLLTEYKATVDSLTKEMAAIGGGDPLSLGSGRSRKELAEEAEMERAAKVEIQKGTIPFLSSYDLPADSLLA
jgi:mitotic spindle assembly checkpoint protein MAD1